MRKMHPYFVVAAFGSMHPNLPFRFRTRWFQEAAYVSPFTWYASRSPQPEPGGIGKFVFAFGSSMMLIRRRSLLEKRRHSAPWKSPATTCKHQLLSHTTFLGITVVDVERHHVEEGFAVAQLSSERCTGDEGL